MDEIGNSSCAGGNPDELNPSQREINSSLMDATARLERITFNSNPLKQTYSQIRIPLVVREPGCWFSAPYGEGKTSALSYCAAALRKEFKGLPVYLINEYVLPSNELKSFLIKALRESGHALSDGTFVVKLRNRLTSYWAELSAKSPLGCVVLIIDEGQALRPTDLYVLRDLGNDIAAKNGSLHTFIFGESPKLDTLVSKYGKTGGDEALGGAFDRILGGHKLSIFGYTTLDDWKSLFIDMDNRKLAEFGNRTIREVFFGHVDSSDFLFEKQVDSFYSALKEVQKNRSGNLNLRRIFVGIRLAIFSGATASVNSGAIDQNSFSEAKWLVALNYSNSLKE